MNGKLVIFTAAALLAATSAYAQTSTTSAQPNASPFSPFVYTKLGATPKVGATATTERKGATKDAANKARAPVAKKAAPVASTTK